MAEEKFIRKYVDNGIAIQEKKITTNSGKTHTILSVKPEEAGNFEIPIPQPSTEPRESMMDKFSHIERQNLLILDSITTLRETMDNLSESLRDMVGKELDKKK